MSFYTLVYVTEGDIKYSSVKFEEKTCSELLKLLTFKPYVFLRWITCLNCNHVMLIFVV